MQAGTAVLGPQTARVPASLGSTTLMNGFQPQSHLMVQERSWSSSHHNLIPDS